MRLQKLLLPLLLVKESDGRLRGRTRFQKLIFLYQELSNSPLAKFQYFAWDYGPYSKELQAFVDLLVENGFLAEEAVEFEAGSGKKIYEYRLTTAGRTLLESQRAAVGTDSASRELRAISDEWGSKDLDEVLGFVYNTFPAYAAKSKLLLPTP